MTENSTATAYSMSGNSTCEEDPEHRPPEFLVSLAVVAVLIIILNLSVIWSVYSITRDRGRAGPHRDKFSVTYLLLGNLAVTDAGTGILLLILCVVPAQYRNYTGCTAVLGVLVWLVSTSAYTMVLIAADRAVFLCQSLKYHVYITTRRAKIAICCAWSIASLLALSLCFFFPSGETCGTLSPCSLTRIFTKRGVIITVILSVLVPLISIVICYLIILVKVQSYLRSDLYKMSKRHTMHLKSKKLELKGNKDESQKSAAGDIQIDTDESLNTGKRNTLTDGSQATDPGRKKSMKRQLSTLLPISKDSLVKACKTGVFVVAYMCTCFPYFVGCLMYALCSGENCLELSAYADVKLSILGFVNSIVNPLLYAWWHKGFRKTVYRICKKS